MWNYKRNIHIYTHIYNNGSNIILTIGPNLDINDIVHNLVQDLGHPIPYIENRRRNVRPRNENYYELTIPRYTDVQFIEHFRMSRRIWGMYNKIYNIFWKRSLYCWYI